MIEDIFPTSSVLSDEFLRPSFYSLHRDVIDQVVAIIGETLRLKKGHLNFLSVSRLPIYPSSGQIFQAIHDKVFCFLVSGTLSQLPLGIDMPAPYHLTR